ncbi:MAG: hypothetical protein ABI175_03830, partial [Polyangiales bacterium]
MRWLCATLVLLSACTDLPDFGDGCGNLVLEVGEDCDGDASGQCDDSCNLRCGGDEQPCPDGYVCGADSFCHAPSGTFTPFPSSTPFQSDVYAVTDVDLDGYGDVVSITTSSLDTNFGDLEARLA